LIGLTLLTSIHKLSQEDTRKEGDVPKGLAARKAVWAKPAHRVTNDVVRKYIATVKSA